jgi:hypothetical protein
VILDRISEYFAQNPESGIEQVRITLFDQPAVDAFQKVWQKKELGEG